MLGQLLGNVKRVPGGLLGGFLKKFHPPLLVQASPTAVGGSEGVGDMGVWRVVGGDSGADTLLVVYPWQQQFVASQ